MLLANYSTINSSPGRNIGGRAGLNLLGSYTPGKWYSFYTPTIEYQASRENAKASLPTGTEPPYSWILAPKGGEVSSSNQSNGSGSLSIYSLSLGKAIAAGLTGSGSMTANMSLITSMAATIAGSGTLSASMVGVVNMACSLAGSGNITAAMGALAFCVASLSGSGTVTSDLKGKSWMEADIYVNQSQATVDQIVEGVVEGMGTITATVPELLNTESGDIIIPLG